MFWEAGGETPGCGADNNNCYINSTCGIGIYDSDNTTANSTECGFWVWYHTQNTTGSGWSCNVTANDTSDDWTAGTSTEDAFDMGSLVAIDINESTMDFGTLVPGQTAPMEVNVSNYGNIQLDVRLNGTNLSGESGMADIDLSNFMYNCTDAVKEGMDDGHGTNLSTTLTTCPAFDLVEASDTGQPSPTEDTVFWRLYVPYGTADKPIRGAYTGTIWFIGVAG